MLSLERFAWIEGRSLYLVPLQPEHMDVYRALLEEKENLLLWRQMYQVEPGTLSEFVATIINSLGNYDAMTWSILDKATDKVIGWATLSLNTSDVADVALFLPRLRRSEKGTECMHFLGAVVFDELSMQRLDFRAGQLTEALAAYSSTARTQAPRFHGLHHDNITLFDEGLELTYGLVYTHTGYTWPRVKNFWKLKLAKVESRTLTTKLPPSHSRFGAIIDHRPVRELPLPSELSPLKWKPIIFVLDGEE
ncbi:hypothetical protein LTR17_017209 [Elasticomyces elasticus]|nr:hypothetical protein LTR17_017209 [Elasticomyces elasticus]